MMNKCKFLVVAFICIVISNRGEADKPASTVAGAKQLTNPSTPLQKEKRGSSNSKTFCNPKRRKYCTTIDTDDTTGQQSDSQIDVTYTLGPKKQRKPTSIPYSIILGNHVSWKSDRQCIVNESPKHTNDKFPAEEYCADLQMRAVVENGATCLRFGVDYTHKYLGYSNSEVPVDIIPSHQFDVCLDKEEIESQFKRMTE